jgi:catechol 2,3-dioxygenase-like lactoylglutathione lyase family enzyme
MRGLALFFAGVLAGGLAVHSAIAEGEHSSPNTGVIGLNHIAIAVPDIDSAVAYYTKVMGFPEAFRLTNKDGQVQLVYVQISKNTFIELLPTNRNRPAGLNHFGVHVANMEQAVAMWKARGAKVDEIVHSGTKAVLSNVYDPNGVRMELTELPPESMHAQASARWH